MSRLKKNAQHDEHELGMIRTEMMQLYRHYGDEAYTHPRYEELKERANTLTDRIFPNKTWRA